MSFPLDSHGPHDSGLTPGLSPHGLPPEIAEVLRAAAAALTAAAQALQHLPAQAPLSHAPPKHAPCQPIGGRGELQPPIARHDSGVLLGELVRDYLLARARAGRSDRYIRQLRTSLAHWVQGRSKLPIESITAEMIEGWLDARGGAVRTRRGYLKDLRTLFEWTIRRQWLSRNPANFVELPQGGQERAIQVHTPEEVGAVLRTAYQEDPDVGRHLAVRYFAGLRSAEAHRIREGALLLENGFLEVSAAHSKTRSRRLVTLQPALLAFLGIGGELRPMSPNRIRGVVLKSGVDWPHNVTRHSFVSYHLGQFGSASKTAVEAGHSEAMLFRHYRALVTPSAAAAFWALRP